MTHLKTQPDETATAPKLLNPSVIALGAGLETDALTHAAGPSALGAADVAGHAALTPAGTAAVTHGDVPGQLNKNGYPTHVHVSIPGEIMPKKLAQNVSRISINCEAWREN